MNARPLFAALAAAALALALASCGTSEKETEKSSAGPSTTGSPVDLSTTGTITGSVKLDGAPPAPHAINMGAAAKCGELHATRPMSEEVVPGANGTLQNVVVYLKGDFSRYSFPPAATPVDLDQQGCMFVPHVVAVMIGQHLHVENSDEITHNVNRASNKNPRRNESEPAGGPMIVQTFANEEVAIPVKCNIHPWMKAYVAVLATPYFQVTGSDGSFQLKNVPPGTYTVVAWHEKYGTTEQSVTIAPKEEKSVTLAFQAAAAN